MVTKDQLKRGVDKLPENLLDEVFKFLKAVMGQKENTHQTITKRNFHGKLDNTDIRKAAYE